jgi:hypothetical protein
MQQEMCRMSHDVDDEMISPADISIEMQTITRKAAEPLQPGDSVKAQIRRAARALGIEDRRARTFWYGQTEAVWAHEADALRRWYRKWKATELERAKARVQQLELEWQTGAAD